MPAKHLLDRPAWPAPCADILERCLCAGYVVDSMAGPLVDGSEGGTALHLAVAQGCEEVGAGCRAFWQVAHLAGCRRVL